MAQGLFIGSDSDTLWALRQVLSLVCAAVAPVGICLRTPPECFVRYREGGWTVTLQGGEIGDTTWGEKKKKFNVELLF